MAPKAVRYVPATNGMQRMSSFLLASCPVDAVRCGSSLASEDSVLTDWARLRQLAGRTLRLIKDGVVHSACELD